VLSASRARHREYIKYQLRMRGSSLAEVSRELGITAATVSQVCGGLRTSDRVLRAIAVKLGTSVEALRPERAEEEITER
jgi:Ner family transcriptional regulator